MPVCRVTIFKNIWGEFKYIINFLTYSVRLNNKYDYGLRYVQRA